MSNIDKTMPQGKWEFDENVACVFDNMLQNSIPSYDRMRALTYRIGRRFVTPGTTIVDLGASLGRAIEPFAQEFGRVHDVQQFTGDEVTGVEVRGNFYNLFEVAPAMRERLQQNVVLNAVDAVLSDDSLSEVDSFMVSNIPCSLILSVLTLQFTPIEHRQRILETVYDSLQPGGAFILVEKVLGDDSFIDRLLVDVYYEMKGGNGYSPEAIAAKRKSLEGVLVPVTAEWNADLLRKTGFKRVDSFYRDLNFAGWIAVK